MNHIKISDPDKLSGLILMATAILAIIINNSALTNIYDALLSTPFMVQLGEAALDKPLLLWINDGLMAIFFFLVGLEIKKEILGGELSSLKKASLPLFAALGGMMVPALIYISLNIKNEFGLQGWAVPMATDIAFALGILAIVGKGLPKELKILLLSLAIIDDLGAIIVIALFYTDHLSVMSLCLSALGLLGAIGLNIFGVKRITPYVLIGIFIWVCVLKSGVHATLAGVFLAMCIPLAKEGSGESYPGNELIHSLHNWVYFMIMPIFAFANAGVSFFGFQPVILLEKIPLGIILGLFLGKQLGVFGFIWVGVKTGLCQKPDSLNWLHIYGLAALTGIGFTMSLFIGTLAFESEVVVSQVRLSILVASTLSAVLAYGVLKYSMKKYNKP